MRRRTRLELRYPLRSPAIEFTPPAVGNGPRGAFVQREYSVHIQSLNWLSPITLLLLLPALLRGQAPRTASIPVIDMHFHTMWQEPNKVNPSTSFAPVKTPEEMRRRNIAALDRNHIVKVVASGDPDQLPLYEQELGARLLPGMLLQAEPESPAALRQRHKAGNSQHWRSSLLNTEV